MINDMHLDDLLERIKRNPSKFEIHERIPLLSADAKFPYFFNVGVVNRIVLFVYIDWANFDGENYIENISVVRACLSEDGDKFVYIDKPYQSNGELYKKINFPKINDNGFLTSLCEKTNTDQVNNWLADDPVIVSLSEPELTRRLFEEFFKGYSNLMWLSAYNLMPEVSDIEEVNIDELKVQLRDQGWYFLNSHSQPATAKILAFLWLLSLNSACLLEIEKKVNETTVVLCVYGRTKQILDRGYTSANAYGSLFMVLMEYSFKEILMSEFEEEMNYLVALGVDEDFIQWKEVGVRERYRTNIIFS